MLTQDLDEGATHASFRTHLDAGPLLLHTWFDDAGNQPLCGAYYVYVEKLSD